MKYNHLLEYDVINPDGVKTPHSKSSNCIDELRSEYCAAKYYVNKAGGQITPPILTKKSTS